MLTIKKASAATGVPEHTLRAWERRYGLFAPTRSPGGYRVYDEAALERIRAMNALVRDGVPPREASVAVLRRDVSWVTEAGGWAAGSDPDSRLVEAAGALDPAGIARVLDEQFARGDFEILFPKRFTRVLKFLQLLPRRFYFALIRRATGV